MRLDPAANPWIMNNDNPSNTGAVEEQLVAYLDGELTAAEARALETQLGADERLRHELNALDAAWNQLDLLPRSEAGGEFTRTTVEMVAVQAEEDAEPSRAAARRRKLWAGAAAVAVLSVVSGFVFAGVLWPDPNRALLEDLPVIERLDQYRRVESVELLERLARDGFFQEESRSGS